MKQGPQDIFDQEDLNVIFKTCVHLVGAVNAIEEGFALSHKDFTEHPLIPLRQLCLNCLAELDNIIAKIL